MAIDGLPERLAFLNRGQRWVVRKLQALLPTLAQPDMHHALTQMLVAHEKKIGSVDVQLRIKGGDAESGVADLSVISWAGHIMRCKGHGYADEEEKTNWRVRQRPEGRCLNWELLDQLVKGPMTPAEVQDLMLAFNKAVIERAMGAEMNLHLGYPPGQPPPGQANERNGASGKTVITDRGPVRVDVPRDRDGSFEPILIPKHERRFTGFDERIIAMYARGMSVREIQGFLAEHYGTEVSPDFISSVTDEVMAEALSWQSRPLETMYPVVFFDALRVKIRDDGVVSNKAVYLALGIQADGQRDVLGLWIEQTEGAKFWLKVFNELKTRGCQDILIAVVDGLKGLTEAISAAYPRTTVQTCIVHLIRNSLEYASYKDRKALRGAASDLRGRQRRGGKTGVTGLC